MQVNIKLQERMEKLNSPISSREFLSKNILSIRKNNENKISTKRSSSDINEEPSKMKKQCQQSGTNKMKNFQINWLLQKIVIFLNTMIVT